MKIIANSHRLSMAKWRHKSLKWQYGENGVISISKWRNHQQLMAANNIINENKMAKMKIM
jgi:hypothetical protein